MMIKRILPILGAIVALCLFVVGYQKVNEYHNSKAYIDQEMKKLPADATAQDLEELGFWNFTEPFEQEPGALAAYFGPGNKTGNRVLKAFVEDEDGIVVYCFFPTRKQMRTEVATYRQKDGFIKSVDSSYHLNRDPVATEDGIVEVWLREAEWQMHLVGDLLLYRYLQN